MKEKFLKISRLEAIVLVMTVLFIAGTVVWYLTIQARPGLAITTTETDRVLEAPDTPVAPGMLEGERIDLNTASVEELTRLPGIGEVKAQAIVDWRSAYGDFRVVEDLLGVRGIGEATLETLRPYVTVGAEDAEGGD